jgi:L-glyceraldehyde 3-phosphate reductase
MPLHHLAMRWALRSPTVTSAIIGARNLAQLDDTLDALNSPAPDDALLDAIAAIAPHQ